MEIFVNGKAEIELRGRTTGTEIKQYIEKQLGLISEQYYLIGNGKRIQDCNIIENCRLNIIPRVFGGKGGFGSMLRAIGAQIEKTTNREACRDLSGRRLRDINEEQRLKNWINQQAEREKEAKQRRQKKLERLCERPKHEFKDDEYDKERSALPEKVEDAVLQGLQASCSTKRKTTEKETAVKKKKPKLWVDDELDEELSSSDGEGEQSNSEENAGKSESDVSNKSEDKLKNTEDCSLSDDKVENSMLSRKENKIKEDKVEEGSVSEETKEATQNV